MRLGDAGDPIRSAVTSWRTWELFDGLIKSSFAYRSVKFEKPDDRWN